MRRFKTGLVIGRFQPFHLGHLFLIKKALKFADKIIIAVGSSNVKDHDNPLSYKTRAEMLRIVIEKENWEKRVLKIVPSPDHPSDEVWLKLLLKNTGSFDAEIGNNDWTNGILEKAGYQTIRVPYFKRRYYQGIYVRKIAKIGGNWKPLVPSYLINFVSNEFLKIFKSS